MKKINIKETELVTILVKEKEAGSELLKMGNIYWVRTKDGQKFQYTLID